MTDLKIGDTVRTADGQIGKISHVYLYWEFEVTVGFKRERWLKKGLTKVDVDLGSENIKDKTTCVTCGFAECAENSNKILSAEEKYKIFMDKIERERIEKLAEEKKNKTFKYKPGQRLKFAYPNTTDTCVVLRLDEETPAYWARIEETGEEHIIFECEWEPLEEDIKGGDEVWVKGIFVKKSQDNVRIEFKHTNDDPNYQTDYAWISKSEVKKVAE